MAVVTNFTIRKGRTEQIEVTVTDVTVWTGLVAKLFAGPHQGNVDPVITLVGTINAGANKITFDFYSVNTNTLEVSSLYYEIALYKADGTYLRDVNYGILSIDPVIVTDPANFDPDPIPPSVYAFQTPVFANPLNLNAALYKDFKCGVITGNTVINLNNTIDGDSGMIEIIMNAAGGYTVTLGTMFTKDIGGTALDTIANADNFIGWRNVAGDIVYSIAQVQ